MGCLCPKKRTHINSNLLESLNDSPAPLGTSQDPESNINYIEKPKYEDLPQKKKLVEYLFNDELKAYKKLLPEIKKFNDEQFNNLFEGKTDYLNFNVSDPKRFKSIVSKFEIHYDLLIEFYENEENYKYINEIWKSNIVIQSLKGKSENEMIKIFDENKIDFKNWPIDIKEKIKRIINESVSIENLSEIMKDFIEENYKNIDELIKKTEGCKEMVKKEEEESQHKRILEYNLDDMVSKLIKDFVPDFVNSLPSICKDVKSEIKKREMELVINKMKKSGFTETKAKSLIEEVKKKYKEEKYTGVFKPVEDLKDLNELGIKFNKGEINELSFKDKIGISLGNEKVGNVILSLSLVNLTYSILHLNQTFAQENDLKVNLERFNNIKRKFKRHKDEIDLLPDNIEKKAEEIKKLRKKFEEDRQEVDNLLKDIEDAVNGIQNERNKSIIELISSCGGTLVGFAGSFITKGDNRGDYIITAGSSFLSVIANSIDVHKSREQLKKYKELREKVEKLRKDIDNEIIELENKFNELKNAHKPKFYC